ncbi:hypothetical protein [Actinokineospora sp.]|uniref:hypothetical protein n=1 Tax=Actinokineospora sp. TaxID=1872133 RepID=UPI00403810C2
MSTPHALTTSLDLTTGPIGYRISEDYLELFVGADDSAMTIALNFSAECVITLASIIEHAIPALRSNQALMDIGQFNYLTEPRQHTITIGDTLSAEQHPHKPSDKSVLVSRAG